MPQVTIIGERINSTSKRVRAMLEERDRGAVRDLVAAQAEAGAEYIDLNASMLMERERETLDWLVAIVRELYPGIGLSIDSPDAGLLLDYAETAGPGGILNSITCDEELLERALAVVKGTGVRVIVMLKDSAGIPGDAGGRLALARRAATIAGRHGVPPGQMLFDPVFSPVATTTRGLSTALDTISLLTEHHPENDRVGGLSNVSFGMPLRRLFHRTFLAMAVSRGLNTAICDPTDERLVATLRAAESLAGLDAGCRGFLQYYRSSKPAE